MLNVTFLGREYQFSGECFSKTYGDTLVIYRRISSAERNEEVGRFTGAPFAVFKI